MAHHIISRDHDGWKSAERHVNHTHGKTLHELGWEGEVLHAIERGDDPKRLVIQLAKDHKTPRIDRDAQETPA